LSSALLGARPRLVLHPVLLAAAFVLNIALGNEVEVAGIVRPLAVAMTFASLLTLAAWAVIRNRWDGALVATVLLLALATPVPAYRAWEVLAPLLGPAGTLAAFGMMLTLLLGVPAVLALRALRRGRPVPRPGPGGLNAFAILLLAVVVLSGTLPRVPAAIGQLAERPVEVDVPTPAEPPPNIVVILLDGYPRADILQRRLGIDNSAFLAELRNLGFDVADDSRSNYEFTGLTLASMFQMRYLDEVPRLQPLIGTPGAHHDAVRDAAADGSAFTAMRAAGYEVVLAPPDWEHAKLRSAGDRILEHGQLTDLERTALGRTWLLDLVTVVAPNIFTEQERDLLVAQLDDLDAFAAAPPAEPTFLFIHVPGPHAPQVVDANGDPVRLAARQIGADNPAELGVSREEYERGYAEEVAYMNRRVLAAVERLQATDPMATIIIMSDHGYTQEPMASDPEARFGNLFAAYTPGVPGLFADAPTPVNVFAILLNAQLGTSLPVHEDGYFLSADEFDPLLLTEALVMACEGRWYRFGACGGRVP
jgi:hypothetical protein